MVESSAAALKILPSLQKCLFFWTNLDTKGGGDIEVGWGGLCRSFQKIGNKGTLYNPLGLHCCHNNSFSPCGLSNLSNQAGITNFASPGISRKPAALNCLLL